jgi:hypothetical protein
VDPLRKEAIERVLRTPMQERVRQTFEAARLGIRLRRAALRAQNPQATEQEIDSALREWLQREH